MLNKQDRVYIHAVLEHQQVSVLLILHVFGQKKSIGQTKDVN